MRRHNGQYLWLGIGVRAALCTLMVAACSGGGGASDPAVPAGTYALQIESEQWVEPEGIGVIIGTYVPDFLLGVRSSGDATIQLLGAVAEEPLQTQDLCAATVVFPVSTLSEGGAFVAGPVVFPITITGYDVAIQDLTISGTFTSDATAFVAARFDGMLDAREFEAFFANDATGVCALVASVGASCEVCPSDAAPYCLRIRAEGMQARHIPGLELEVVPTPDPSCDATRP